MSSNETKSTNSRPSFVPAAQYNNIPRVKKGTINPATGKPWTEKSKPVLGISNDREVVWAGAHFDLYSHNTLLAFCKSLDMPADELLALVAMDWFAKNREAIEKAAEAHMVGEKTVDDAKKELEAAQRKLARLQEFLAAAEAKAKGEGK